MSIVIAIIVFSILVLVHEFGHFIVARMNDVKVEEFAIGMGPKLISKKVGETVYSIRILPLGGFCKMLGEEESSDDSKAFCNKRVPQRMAIVVAGAFMNFIYAFIAILIAVSMMPYVRLPEVGEIYKNSPAEKAGIQVGDKILKINGSNIKIYEDIKFETLLINNSEKQVEILIDRNGEKKQIISSFYGAISIENLPEDLLDKTALKIGDYVSEIDGKDVYFIKDIEKELEGKNSVDVKVIDVEDGTEKLLDNEDARIFIVNQTKMSRIIGFQPAKRKLNIIETLGYSYNEFEFFIRNTWVSLGKIVTGQISTKMVSGPVGIVKYLGDTYDASINASDILKEQIFNVLINLLIFSALLSANLGVINLMPLPALDGGRIAFMVVELIRGKPIDTEKENWVHVIGFALLMLLMVLVFYNDIVKIMKGIV